MAWSHLRSEKNFKRLGSEPLELKKKKLGSFALGSSNIVMLGLKSQALGLIGSTRPGFKLICRFKIIWVTAKFVHSCYTVSLIATHYPYSKKSSWAWGLSQAQILARMIRSHSNKARNFIEKKEKLAILRH